MLVFAFVMRQTQLMHLFHNLPTYQRTSSTKEKNQRKISIH